MPNYYYLDADDTKQFLIIKARVPDPLDRGTMVTRYGRIPLSSTTTPVDNTDLSGDTTLEVPAEDLAGVYDGVVAVIERLTRLEMTLRKNGVIQGELEALPT